MSYPDPRVNPQGFPYATDIFPNDTELSADGPAEWKRELPPFGPAFVPFIDGRLTELEKAVHRLIAVWAFQSVTITDVATVNTDSSGNIDLPAQGNASLYESPAGFTLALHRLVITVGGSTFGSPFTGAGGYWELRVNQGTIYGASMVSGSGSLPVVVQWGTRDAPRVRAGQVLSLFMSGGPTSKAVTVAIQGTLDRTQEG